MANNTQRNNRLKFPKQSIFIWGILCILQVPLLFLLPITWWKISSAEAFILLPSLPLASKSLSNQRTCFERISFQKISQSNNQQLQELTTTELSLFKIQQNNKKNQLGEEMYSSTTIRHDHLPKEENTELSETSSRFGCDNRHEQSNILSEPISSSSSSSSSKNLMKNIDISFKQMILSATLVVLFSAVPTEMATATIEPTLFAFQTTTTTKVLSSTPNSIVLNAGSSSSSSSSSSSTTLTTTTTVIANQNNNGSKRQPRKKKQQQPQPLVNIEDTRLVGEESYQKNSLLSTTPNSDLKVIIRAFEDPEVDGLTLFLSTQEASTNSLTAVITNTKENRVSWKKQPSLVSPSSSTQQNQDQDQDRQQQQQQSQTQHDHDRKDRTLIYSESRPSGYPFLFGLQSDAQVTRYYDAPSNSLVYVASGLRSYTFDGKVKFRVPSSVCAVPMVNE